MCVCVCVCVCVSVSESDSLSLFVCVCVCYVGMQQGTLYHTVRVELSTACLSGSVQLSTSLQIHTHTRSHTQTDVTAAAKALPARNTHSRGCSASYVW